MKRAQRRVNVWMVSYIKIVLLNNDRLDNAFVYTRVESGWQRKQIKHYVASSWIKRLISVKYSFFSRLLKTTTWMTLCFKLMLTVMCTTDSWIWRVVSCIVLLAEVYLKLVIFHFKASTIESIGSLIEPAVLFRYDIRKVSLIEPAVLFRYNSRKVRLIEPAVLFWSVNMVCIKLFDLWIWHGLY